MRRREALKWIGGVAAFSVASPRWANPLAAVPPQEIEGLWSDRVGQLEAPGPDEFVLTAVGDMIISSPASTRPEPQARQMYRVMREADLAFGNCEEAIASVGYIEPKASAMGWPSILDDFKAAGLDILALANNHYMDLGEEAALQGLEEMSDRGFVVAGGGKDLEGALSPGIATAKGRRVGTLAFWCAAATVDGTSYIERARATDSKPGVAVISGHEVTIPGGSGSSMLLPRASDLHRLIREQAGHAAIAEAIRFANHDGVGLERASPRRTDSRNAKPRLPHDRHADRRGSHHARRPVRRTPAATLTLKHPDHS